MRNLNLQAYTDVSDSHLHAFKLTSGKELLSFTEIDFQQLLNTYTGSFLFSKFHEHLEERRSKGFSAEGMWSMVQSVS